MGKRPRCSREKFRYSSTEGKLYFVTLICAEDIPYLGAVVNEHMECNEIGKIAKKLWY